MCPFNKKETAAEKENYSYLFVVVIIAAVAFVFDFCASNRLIILLGASRRFAEDGPET